MESIRPSIAPSADVDATASIGDGSVIWHLAQIRENAVLGTRCLVGRGAYVGAAVRIGDNVKIQNYALVYEPATLASGVFIGPGAILTNDRFPRSVSPEGVQKRAGDWQAAGIRVESGASVGAGALIVAGVTLGAWSMVAAGAVVTRDVPAHALMLGTPARRVGWVGRAGERLVEGPEGDLRCPRTGEMYRLIDDVPERQYV